MNCITHLSISDATNLALLVVTSAVSIFGVYQFIATTKFNRNQSAKEMHGEYIRLALENPTLANPDISGIDCQAMTLGGDRVAFERYEWFISYMLLSFEEALHLSPDPSWFQTIESNLKMHTNYLKSEYFQSSGYLDNLDGRIVRLIRNL